MRRWGKSAVVMSSPEILPMNPTPALASPADLLRLLIQFPLRWLAPSALVALSACGYAGIKSDTWEAQQALIVRNEAARSSLEAGLGKFRHADEMKALLETVLELAMSHNVLAQALSEVGPPEGRTSSDAWPTDQEIADFAPALSVTPPKGAEFGKTEVFYIKVKDGSRQRALALTTAVCEQLEARFDQLRDSRAKSMGDELSKAVELAHVDVDKATARLKGVEQQVGSDLSELRNLQESHGDSDLRKKSLELESELRQAEVSQRSLRKLAEILVASKSDQGQLLATPAGLLEDQPTLKKLKEELALAQVHTSTLMGSMTALNPQVVAARETEEHIRSNVRVELDVILRGVTHDLDLAEAKVNSLEDQLGRLQKRLDKLAGLRAEYASLVAEVNHRTQLLETVQRELSEARASQAGSQTSLIAPLDAPTTGPKPIGPSRAIIAAAGAAAGPVLGIGLLMLTLPMGTSPASTARNGSTGSTARNGTNGRSNGSNGASRQHELPLEQVVAERERPH